MPAALDRAPHVLVMELHERSKNADTLSSAAVSLIEGAGATCERIIVVQPEDMVMAANYAARAQKFDALVALAELDGTKGKRRLITDGLQKVALQHSTPVGHGLIEVAALNPQEVGVSAAESALRLFAIKARFNPLLNEA